MWGRGGGGGAYNRMYALFTGRRAYSGGGGGGEGAVADPDLQIRGGGGHPVPEKEVGGKGGTVSKKLFGPTLV